LLDYFSETSKYLGFINNPVLLKASHALHGHEVSPKFPRIEGVNGNIAMHLTADPSKPGHNLVEFVEYLPEKGTYRFSAIDFLLSGTKDMFIDDGGFLPESTQSIHRKAVGEFHDCASCHSNGRPIWPATNSTLTDSYGGGENEIRSNTPEFDDYQSFLDVVRDPTLGRLYRKLTIKTATKLDGTIRFVNSPNTRFIERFHEKAIARLAIKLRLDPLYTKFQYAMVGALFDCTDIEGFLPLQFKEKHEQKILDAFDRSYSWWQHVIHLNEVPKVVLEQVTPLEGQIPELTKFYTEPVLLKSKLMLPTEIFRLGINAANRKRKDGPLSPEYVSTMAKLRYVYESGLEQDSALLDQLITTDFYLQANDEERRKMFLSFQFPEFYNWFPATGHYEKNPEVFSFRGEMAAINEMLENHLGRKFLQDNSNLNVFENSSVRLDTLTIPREEFCSQLKEKSIQALGRTL
jgi:hypothetical protein